MLHALPAPYDTFPQIREAAVMPMGRIMAVRVASRLSLGHYVTGLVTVNPGC